MSVFLVFFLPCSWLFASALLSSVVDLFTIAFGPRLSGSGLVGWRWRRRRRGPGGAWIPGYFRIL
eukprot:4674689-Prymnesium_polylepis.1